MNRELLFKHYTQHFIHENEIVVEHEDGILFMEDIRSPQFYESYEELWQKAIRARVIEIYDGLDADDTFEQYLLRMAGLDQLESILLEDETPIMDAMVARARELYPDMPEGSPQTELEDGILTLVFDQPSRLVCYKIDVNQLEGEYEA